jgi:hypothetical protein
MIHFDFTVSDVDAQNILQIMRERINANNVKIIDHMVQVLVQEGHEDYIAAYRRDNEYVEGLIQKMTNTRVAQ